MLSTGFILATRQLCATMVSMTMMLTVRKDSGNSHQCMGVCSAKFCSHCLLSM